MPTKSLNERAEYDRGYAEGYRLGQAETIEKLKAEIKNKYYAEEEPTTYQMGTNLGLRLAVEILDNIGKGE